MLLRCIGVDAFQQISSTGGVHRLSFSVLTAMKNLKKFAATAKCGPVEINVYKREKIIRGKSYAEYSFGDYSSGKCRMRSFSDLDEAKQEAQKAAEAVLRGEVAVNHLNAKQKLSCVRA